MMRGFLASRLGRARVSVPQAAEGIHEGGLASAGLADDGEVEPGATEPSTHRAAQSHAKWLRVKKGYPNGLPW